MPPIDRNRVLAFRASAHSLDARRPEAELLGVAGACGIQDTPPGNADVSLAARLDIDKPVVGQAIEQKQLVLTWSLRGAPHLVPKEDLAVFTLGGLPAEGTREGLWGQPEHALVDVEKVMVGVLGPDPRPKGEVSEAATAVLSEELTPWCRGCKVHHPNESVFRAAPLLGRIVLTSTAPVLLTKAATWLGADAAGDIESLRRELLRRYLRCYAPTIHVDFAAWAGIATSDAKQRWAALADDLVPVEVERAGRSARKAFVLEDDLERLARPPASRGVRLVPNKDALLQARDRDLLFPDPAIRKKVFPVLGGPGVVLHEASPVAVWRGTAKARRYDVAVQPFGTLPKAVRAEVEAEADRVAHVRGLALGRFELQ